MPYLCPRPCGRLATAAVFVSVGVVQFIAGLILLKSKYVYLLAAPDFWTSASNLAVGSLIGISASVWQNIHKASFKHATRRNLLAALVVTSILMNVTTAVILIMGEGNALLSINLENDGIYSAATLGSEILAYSYATSVCSPIVCIVIAIAFLSGIWFRTKDKEEKTIEFKSILKRNSFDDYQWVFKEKQGFLNPDSQITRKAFSFKSLSSSSDEESSSSTNSTLREVSDFSDSPLLKKIQRIKAPLPKSRGSPNLPCECGEHLFGDVSQTTAYETSHGSSVGNYERTPKHQKDLSFAARRHSHHSGQYAQIQPFEYRKNDSSLSYTDFKRNHQSLVHFKVSPERKMLLEHPVPQNTKFTNRNERIQSLHSPSPKIYSIQSQSQRISNSEPSTQSLVVADVHVDPRSFNNPNLHRSEHLPEEKLFYDGRASYEVPKRLTDNVSKQHAHYQRSSSHINLKEPNILNSEGHLFHERSFVQVRRTSTSTLNSSRISLEISGIETDSMINPDYCHDHEETLKTEFDSLFHGENLDISQMDSTIDVDDTFYDTAMSNSLAGKMIPVQVGSISRNPLSHKLIPVPIPKVSSIKKSPLLDKQKRDVALNGTEKIIGRKTVNFSSFRNDVKSKSKDSHCKSRDGEFSNPSKKEYTFASPPTSTVEALEENLPPSPAHTSGYDSTFDETAHTSYSSNFRPNSAPLNLSGIDEDCSFFTPKKKLSSHLTSKPLFNTKESPEPVAEDLEQIVNQIINKTSITKKKELIAQLLNDVSTQKVTEV
ncbi:uncharacterized protein TNIN_418011 [Trichonephila inaurata madagascariensis]|uniref:Uncharacterized protein n=1 Tax=Trichonephila inaurata madagascariensis TaxID=2747483 RepID=A0A8X7CK97_9ARAC|nr:uncharacterized protein TNIN_418011 [Trichonephila inaurata madagascariensis]